MAGAAYYRVLVGKARTPTRSSSTHGDLFGRRWPYPAMTEISERLKRPAPTTGGSRPTTATGVASGPAPGAPSRSADRGRRPATRWRSAAAPRRRTTPARTRARRRPAAARCPATPVLKWDPDPAWPCTWSTSARTPASPTCSSPATSIPATTNSMYTPALDNDDRTYGDNQAGGVLLVRPAVPRRRPLRTRPGVGVDESAQGTFIKKLPAVTGLESTLHRRRDHIRWDDYWRDPLANRPTRGPRPGERCPRRPSSTASRSSASGIRGVVDSAVVDQTTYTAVGSSTPKGPTVARPGHRLRRQRTHVVDAGGQLQAQSPRIVLTSPVG